MIIILQFIDYIIYFSYITYFKGSSKDITFWRVINTLFNYVINLIFFNGLLIMNVKINNIDIIFYKFYL